VDPRADLLGQRTAFKTELPHLPEGGDEQAELQLKDNTAASLLHELADLPQLTVSIKLMDRRDKHYSQASYLVRPRQSF
jgi:hypothetical protein